MFLLVELRKPVIEPKNAALCKVLHLSQGKTPNLPFLIPFHPLFTLCEGQEGKNLVLRFGSRLPCRH